MNVRAILRDEFHMNATRLLVAVERIPGHTDFLMGDGSWQSVPHGTAPDIETGILLPSETIETIAQAFHPRAGHEVEVKRLSEALTVERQRVDRIVDRALGNGSTTEGREAK